MTTTAIGSSFDSPGCWCCGDRTVRASLLRLDSHPEVGVCFRCVRTLTKRTKTIERMTRHAPPAPWHRRLLYRIGLNRC